MRAYAYRTQLGPHPAVAIARAAPACIPAVPRANAAQLRMMGARGVRATLAAAVKIWRISWSFFLAKLAPDAPLAKSFTTVTGPSDEIVTAPITPPSLRGYATT